MLEKNETIRLFFAITINENIINKIKFIQKELSPISSYVKFVNPDDIHITLKFYAAFNINNLQLLYFTLENACKKNISFEFEISGIGAFPNLKNPRVIWMGISNGQELIRKFQKDIENELYKAGLNDIPENKFFNPHITIARIKENNDSKSYIEKIDFSNTVFANIGKQKVEDLKIVKSVLTGEGPKYTVLNTCKLI